MDHAREGEHDRSERLRPRRVIELAAITAGVVILFVLIWYIGEAFLILFAGMLFGFFLDAGIRGLGRFLPIPRGLRLLIVLLLLAAVVGGFLWIAGAMITGQLGGLIQTLEQQVERLRGLVEEAGIGQLLLGEGPGLGAVLPDPSGMLGRATTALTAVFGAAGNAVVIVMTGAFLALSPHAYRAGLLRLVPMDKRARLGAVLDETGSTLRWWLVGKAINMTVIFVFTWVGLTLIGMPQAFVLGLQAGLFAFIPNLGPVLAGIPIVLTGVAVGFNTMLWALALYAAIQMLESYLLTPFVQKEMVRVFPALTLAAQVVMAALFGALGLALAMPLVAAGQVLVKRLYIEGRLGDDLHEPGRAAADSG